MPFPFTFSFSVPGLYNPFSAENVKGPATHLPGMTPTPPPTASFRHSPVKRRHDLLSSQIYSSPPSRTNSQSSLNRWDHLRRPSPAAPPLLDDQSQSNLLGLASRKRVRGWEPSLPEQSQSRETLTQSKGWLDTPGKYRDMADDEYVGVERGRNDRDTQEEVDATLAQPPAKRRRGLAGSIISTALSAALIGGAVGLTVYRLWRDRGKEPEHGGQQAHEDTLEHEGPLASPPPPYSQHDASQPSSSKQTLHQPTTPSRKRSQRPTHPVSASSKRAGGHRRTARPSRAPYTAAAGAHYPPSSTASAGQMLTSVQPEFDFGQPATAPLTYSSSTSTSSTLQLQPTLNNPNIPAEEADVDDQMDWLGDKLSSLIEQGKRALRSEVVVASESQDDLVDDGTGAWEDQQELHSASYGPSSVVSRNGSVRKVRRNRSQTTLSMSPSPRKQAFNITAAAAAAVSTGGVSGSMPPPLSAWSHNRAYSAESPSMMFQQSTPNLHQYQHQHQRRHSVESTPNTSISADFGMMGGDGGSFESPELQESMRRAREKMMAARAARS